MVSIEEFSNALVRMLTNLIEIIIGIVRDLMERTSTDSVVNLMGYLVQGLDVLVDAIVPLVDWISRMVFAMINITESNETVRLAFHNFTNTTGENLSVIIGPANASSGLMYVLEGMIKETDPGVAGALLQALWDMLAVIMEFITLVLTSMSSI
ncbi:MAG: hypothetical protein SVM80_04830 [Halobacteriota archaeon]|nr:hypothetical protein [Halobacteriota archaeon]